jgi:hypothetical protein
MTVHYEREGPARVLPGEFEGLAFGRRVGGPGDDPRSAGRHQRPPPGSVSLDIVRQRLGMCHSPTVVSKRVTPSMRHPI